MREDHPFNHAPGTCRICWRPCHRRVLGDTAFCEDCWVQLSSRTSAAVKIALLERADLPRWVLEEMTEDLDAQVQYAAETKAAQIASGEADVEALFAEEGRR